MPSSSRAAARSFGRSEAAYTGDRFRAIPMRPGRSISRKTSTARPWASRWLWVSTACTTSASPGTGTKRPSGRARCSSPLAMLPMYIVSMYGSFRVIQVDTRSP